MRVLPPLPLLLALLAPLASAEPAARPPDAAVTVAAVKGFQGLFEWAPGNEPLMPGRALGGRRTTNGTLIDLPAIVRELGGRLDGSPDPDAVHVLTTLRNVHVADEIWIQAGIPVDGALDALVEVPARVVAEDAALNLALLAARQPTSGPRFDRGLRLATAPIRRGQEVVRLEAFNWRLHRSRDVIWTKGLPDRHHDPYRLEALPTWWTQGGINETQAGGPVIDEASGHLVALLSNTVREMRDGNGGSQWRGDAHLIEASRIAEFLLDHSSGSRAPGHGALRDGGPAASTVEPALAALLGIAGSGLYALAPWPETQPVVEAGDVLLRLDGKALGPGGFTPGEIAFDLEPGRDVRLDLLRDGAERSVTVPVVPLERPTGRETAWMTFAGAWIQDPIAALRREGDDSGGPVIAHVDSGSPAEAGELEFGLVVHDVVGAGRAIAVRDVAGLARALREILADPGFDGEIGLRVNALARPGAERAILLLRVEADEPVREVAP